MTLSACRLMNWRLHVLAFLNYALGSLLAIPMMKGLIPIRVQKYNN